MKISRKHRKIPLKWYRNHTNQRSCLDPGPTSTPNGTLAWRHVGVWTFGSKNWRSKHGSIVIKRTRNYCEAFRSVLLCCSLSFLNQSCSLLCFCSEKDEKEKKRVGKMYFWNLGSKICLSKAVGRYQDQLVSLNLLPCRPGFSWVFKRRDVTNNRRLATVSQDWTWESSTRSQNEGLRVGSPEGWNHFGFKLNTNFFDFGTHFSILDLSDFGSPSFLFCKNNPCQGCPQCDCWSRKRFRHGCKSWMFKNWELEDHGIMASWLGEASAHVLMSIQPMVNKPLIRPYFWGGTLGGFGWPATSHIFLDRHFFKLKKVVIERDVGVDPTWKFW